MIKLNYNGWRVGAVFTRDRMEQSLQGACMLRNWWPILASSTHIAPEHCETDFGLASFAWLWLCCKVCNFHLLTSKIGIHHAEWWWWYHFSSCRIVQLQCHNSMEFCHHFLHQSQKFHFLFAVLSRTVKLCWLHQRQLQLQLCNNASSVMRQSCAIQQTRTLQLFPRSNRNFINWKSFTNGNDDR